ncbi:MAG: hypothetical protein EBR55_05145, partial [Chitinophagia bacterium]|nr:hypothetical protein [Chitinophagia bacterium]
IKKYTEFKPKTTCDTELLAWGLDYYGEKFVELYTNYESSGKARKTMNARDLWFKILDAQMETGTPYLCYKDSANKKSNQKTIHSPSIIKCVLFKIIVLKLYYLVCRNVFPCRL